MLNLPCHIQNSHPKCVAVSFSIPMDDGIVSKGKADRVDYSPVYTCKLIRIGIQINTHLDKCKYGLDTSSFHEVTEMTLMTDSTQQLIRMWGPADLQHHNIHMATQRSPWIQTLSASRPGMHIYP